MLMNHVIESKRNTVREVRSTCDSSRSNHTVNQYVENSERNLPPPSWSQVDQAVTLENITTPCITSRDSPRSLSASVGLNECAAASGLDTCCSKNIEERWLALGKAVSSQSTAKPISRISSVHVSDSVNTHLLAESSSPLLSWKTMDLSSCDNNPLYTQSVVGTSSPSYF